MNTYSENQEWQDFAPEMQGELARIKADQAQLVETRNRIMNGGASKEQVFLATTPPPPIWQFSVSCTRETSGLPSSSGRSRPGRMPSRRRSNG